MSLLIFHQTLGLGRLFYGLPPLVFELRFERGFREAREWLALTSTKEELERLCQESRESRKAA